MCVSNRQTASFKVLRGVCTWSGELERWAWSGLPVNNYCSLSTYHVLCTLLISFPLILIKRQDGDSYSPLFQSSLYATSLLWKTYINIIFHWSERNLKIFPFTKKDEKSDYSVQCWFCREEGWRVAHSQVPSPETTLSSQIPSPETTLSISASSRSLVCNSGAGIRKPYFS